MQTPAETTNLSLYFQLPEKVVAKQLGICLTSLKKLCRQQGITRWPYRKIKSLDRKISQLSSVQPVRRTPVNTSKSAQAKSPSSSKTSSPSASDVSDVSCATTPRNGDVHADDLFDDLQCPDCPDDVLSNHKPVADADVFHEEILFSQGSDAAIGAGTCDCPQADDHSFHHVNLPQEPPHHAAFHIAEPLPSAPSQPNSLSDEELIAMLAGCAHGRPALAPSPQFALPVSADTLAWCSAAAAAAAASCFHAAPADPELDIFAVIAGLSDHLDAPLQVQPTPAAHPSSAASSAAPASCSAASAGCFELDDSICAELAGHAVLLQHPAAWVAARS